ncbi:hypothetical protein [Agrococcus jejuensis]|uniref:hypothetical protein n=1 Tax=Agrococcus jejuensis TaxID=399736 RepID=UPI0011AA94A7|nr:hypothetical protein [Agrococcus jejuensis]
MRSLREAKGLDIPLSTGPIRVNSDEHYVLSLCEQIVGRRALREFAFDWLRADPDARGTRRKLPVDAYWPEFAAAAQYYAGPIIPDLATASERTLQRIAYDQRRRTELARYRIELVEISSEQLAHRGTKLLRDAEHDISVLRPLVEAALP